MPAGRTTLTLVASFLSFEAIIVIAHASDSFKQMVAETGCDSRYSEDKKDDLFASLYEGKRMTVTGEVGYVSGGEVGIKVFPSTLTYDVLVELTDPNAAYDLEKEQRISVSFTMQSAGGCFLPFSGDEGVIVGQ